MDTNFRELERLAQTGDAEAQIAYIKALLRSGRINSGAIDLAAYLGHRSSQILTRFKEYSKLNFTKILSEYAYYALISSFANDISNFKVKSKNEDYTTFEPDILMRIAVAAVSYLLEIINNIDSQSYYSRQLRMNSALENIIKSYTSNINFESAYPQIMHIRNNLRLVRRSYPSRESLVHTYCSAAIESLCDLLILMLSPEFDEHSRDFHDAFTLTILYSFNGSLYGDQSRDAVNLNLKNHIKNSLVAWLYFQDPLEFS